MSVTIRPYINGGWEADIRVALPDGTVIRERKKAPASSKSAAERWAEARERVLAAHGKPKPVTKQEVPETPTFKEFAPRFLERYAKANRLKPADRCEALDPSCASRPIRRQDVGLDHDRTCARDEVRTDRAIAEDGQQRVDHVERRAEDGSGVGRDRTGTVLDSVAPYAKKRREFLRFRRVRTARRSLASGIAGVPRYRARRRGWFAMR